MSSRIERALVTGASAGIGAALARALAERGVEVVLVARRRDRLESLAASLPVAAEVLVADLGDPADLARVAARVSSVDAPVDLLVNDAGLGSYGALAEQDPDRLQTLLDVNVTALVRLTRAALPGLVARGRGGIINVGSTAAYQPGPYSAVYGATKAFVRSFTEAVHEETRGTGVRMLLLAPGVTRTEFQAVAGVPDGAFPAVLTADADEVAAAALAAFAADRDVCIPAWTDRLAVAGSQLLPSSVTRRLRARVLRRYIT
jgi:short-subunit dehydrogenase